MAETQGAGTRPKRHRGNVLVCEDDPVQLLVLDAAVRQGGYATLTARTPAEAVRHVRQKGVDAVIADVHLEGGSAFDVLAHLRGAGRDAPVIMITARSTPHLRQRAISMNVTGFLEKPLDIPGLLNRLAAAIGGPGGSILLVEDHPGERAWMVEALKAEGLDAQAASDGSQAMAFLQEKRVDLALVDLNVPGLSGAPLIQEMRRIDPGLSVAMLAGEATREEIRNGYRAGATSLVRKPLCPSRFKSWVRDQLASALRSRRRWEERAERARRRAAQPWPRRLVRWVRGLVNAPAGSRTKRRLIAFALPAAGLLAGVLVAAALLRGYGLYDGALARVDQLVEKANPRISAGSEERTFQRWYMLEQLRLSHQANEATRQYYEGYLSEMRNQNATKQGNSFSGQQGW